MKKIELIYFYETTYYRRTYYPISDISEITLGIIIREKQIM